MSTFPLPRKFTILNKLTQFDFIIQDQQWYDLMNHKKQKSHRKPRYIVYKILFHHQLIISEIWKVLWLVIYKHTNTDKVSEMSLCVPCIQVFQYVPRSKNTKIFQYETWCHNLIRMYHVYKFLSVSVKIFSVTLLLFDFEVSSHLSNISIHWYFYCCNLYENEFVFCCWLHYTHWSVFNFHWKLSLTLCK